MTLHTISGATTSQKEAEDEYHRPDPFVAVVKIYKDLARRFTAFFTVTEEERSKAGIILISEMRDK